MTTARRRRTAAIPAVAAEIKRYLWTSHTDASRSAWRSESFMERARQAHDDLRDALIAEVRGRSAGVALADLLPIPSDTVALTHRKTEPMVRGLFPRAEQATVLALIEHPHLPQLPAPGRRAPLQARARVDARRRAQQAGDL